MKQIIKKCLWVMLAVVLTFLMIRKGQAAADNIWIDGEPTFYYYAALSLEVLRETAIILPAWLLSLLGLARAFFGENWLPFAEKIPVSVTKTVLVAATVLLIGVSVAGAVYSEYTEDPYAVRYRIENRLDGWQTMLAWIWYYGILLYIEQWCIRKGCSRQSIRKKQVWTTVTLVLSFLIVTFLDGAELWYIPLRHVDSPNTLEDYYLWWFSLYIAACFLPILFFAARKTVRLFRYDAQWLTLTTIVPKKITALIALVATGLVVWQIRECHYWGEWALIADVPEYGEAAAIGHLFQAMMWGLVLFYMICLLVKQIRAVHRGKCERKYT